MSMRVDPSYLSKLQINTLNIRNFYISGHIDHGKTTLSDSLVCSNGVISPKLAGKLRFLDSTEEEQRRGITMHSSAISLLFQLEDKSNTSSNSNSNDNTNSNINPIKKVNEEYLINLIDSPGHIDFSSDVSTATRMCDGALIIVDVLEGLCTQTHAVIYKALKEHMKPCIVLNKIDRLIIEMKLTPLEGFHHLRRIIENINALAFTLLNSELRVEAELLGKDFNIDDIDEQNPIVQEWTFTPEKGNIIFASALDCWGFNITKFANLWSKRYGVNKNVLQKYLFEDYYFNVTTKKIVKWEHDDIYSNKYPMFVAMVLNPIWEIYNHAILQNNPSTAASFVSSEFKINILPREINTRDPRSTIQAIFRKWLPLSDTILRMIVRVVPSPIEAQKQRLKYIMDDPIVKYSTTLRPSYDLIQMKMKSIYDDVSTCNIDRNSNVTIFISKMVPVRLGDLSPIDVALYKEKIAREHLENTPLETIDSNTEVFMALGRIFSGVLTRNTDLYILGNRHDPLISITNEKESNGIITNDIPLELQSTVKKLDAGSFGLYLCLGPSVAPIDEVYAGNIVGIIGMSEQVFKTGTIASTWASLPMKAITFQAKPMVSVALEPVSHQDLDKLERGLQALYQYDPVVEVQVDESGQHLMTCLGELHLELCLKTLIDKFAKCEIKASEPLIAFRETIIPLLDDTNTSTNTSTNASHWLPPPWKDTLNLQYASHGKYTLIASTKNLAVSFRCFSIPKDIVTVIENETTMMSQLAELLTRSKEERSHMNCSIWNSIYQSLVSLNGSLEFKIDRCIDTSKQSLDVMLDNILAFGPNNIGSNILALDPSVNMNIWSHNVPSHDINNNNLNNNNDIDNPSSIVYCLDNSQDESFQRIFSRFVSAIVSGFQVTCSNGPMMNEPLFGVGFAIERIDISSSLITSNDIDLLKYIHIDDTFSSTSSNTNTNTNTNTNGNGIGNGNGNGIGNTNSSSSIMIGQLISEVKDALRLTMLSYAMRIVEPIYECELQCDQLQLGNLYSVLSKRRGEVYKEDIIEGTTLFLLSATLPVNESFGFAQELLKKTSGNGTAPQLRFSHWSIMEVDPFWKPKTEDELEEYGQEYHESNNKVRLLIDKIRKRKGLPIEEKIVVSGEKQRTLRR